MKTKLPLILLVALALGLTHLAVAQIYFLNLSTGTTGGDSGYVGGGKINTNFVYVQAEIGTNTAAILALAGTNTWLSLRIDTNATDIAALQLALASGFIVTNAGSNYTLHGTFTGDGTGLTIQGTNLATASVNTNALDSPSLNLLLAPYAAPGGGIAFPGGQSGISSLGRFWQLDETVSGQTNYLHLNTGIPTWTTSP